MALFRILDSSPQQEKRFDHHPYFDVEMLSGALDSGDRFVLFDTSHPCRYEIVSIEPVGTAVRLRVRQPIMWRGAWKGAVVDTEEPDAARQYSV